MRLRSLLGRVYRGAASAFGARALERMIGDGLPARLHEPLRFLFSRRASTAAAAASEPIERRRAELAARSDMFAFEYVAGSCTVRLRARVERLGPDVVTARRIAESASVQRHWGTFLFLCADAGDGGTILELGTCFGISGAYLASARSAPKLVTLEGAPHFAEIAVETLAQVTDRATVVQGLFSATLPDTLARVGTLDLAYVDGHHDGDATIHYVRSILPSLGRGALVVADDIRLSPEMWQAWHVLSALPGVAAAVNVGRFGLLVWEGGDVTAKRYDLARYTGWWPLGPPRASTFMLKP